MNSPRLGRQHDTPILSVLLGLGVILGGFPALVFLFTKWADSPQRQVAAIAGIGTIALFVLLRKKYDALLIALFFFSQFDISLFSIPLDKPVVLQFVFSDLLLGLFVFAALERHERVRADVVGWLWVCLIAWQVAVTFLASPHVHKSVIFILWQVKYLFVYLLVRNMTLSEDLVRQIKIAALAILFLQGSLGIAQLITGRPLGLTVFGEQDPARALFYVNEGLRVSGTLGATNALGGYMAVMLVFVLPFLFRWQGLLSYACFSIGFLALIFPLSRAGWLSFLVGGSIVVGRLWWDGILKLTRIIIFMVIGTMAIGSVALLYLDRIEQRFVDKDAVGSAMGRMHQFEQVWPILERYPVYGIGPGVTEFYGAWTDNASYVRNKLPGVRLGNQPHNSFLQYWIENGVLGGMLFISIMVMTLITAFPKRNHSDGMSALSFLKIGASGAAVAAMVHASFGTEINNYQIVMAFWIALALARNETVGDTPDSELEAR